MTGLMGVAYSARDQKVLMIHGVNLIAQEYRLVKTFKLMRSSVAIQAHQKI
jgi:hypothetical protein